MKDLVERLNDITEHDWRVSILAHTPDTAKEAAAELTRLRALNAELVEALEDVTELLVDTWVYDMSAHGLPEDEVAINTARAALTAALEAKK